MRAVEVARLVGRRRTPRPFLARAVDEAGIVARAKQAPERDLSAAEALHIEVRAELGAEILRQAKARTVTPTVLPASPNTGSTGTERMDAMLAQARAELCADLRRQDDPFLAHRLASWDQAASQDRDHHRPERWDATEEARVLGQLADLTTIVGSHEAARIMFGGER